MSDDEKVGPGRPPKHARWKKGQSGNPRGRPRGSVNVKAAFLEELGEYMTFTTPQGEREMTKLQAIVRRLIHEGLNGKVHAIQDILDRAERLDRANGGTVPAELAKDDEAILRRALSSDPKSSSYVRPDGASDE